MFDVNGKDNSTYNVDNFEFIKKTSPIVGGLIEKEYNRRKKQCGAHRFRKLLFRGGSRGVRQLSLVEVRGGLSLCTNLR